MGWTRRTIESPVDGDKTGDQGNQGGRKVAVSEETRNQGNQEREETTGSSWVSSWAPRFLLS